MSFRLSAIEHLRIRAASGLWTLSVGKEVVKDVKSGFWPISGHFSHARLGSSDEITGARVGCDAAGRGCGGPAAGARLAPVLVAGSDRRRRSRAPRPHAADRGVAARAGLRRRDRQGHGRAAARAHRCRRTRLVALRREVSAVGRQRHHAGHRQGRVSRGRPVRCASRERHAGAAGVERADAHLRPERVAGRSLDHQDALPARRSRRHAVSVHAARSARTRADTVTRARSPEAADGAAGHADGRRADRDRADHARDHERSAGRRAGRTARRQAAGIHDHPLRHQCAGARGAAAARPPPHGRRSRPLRLPRRRGRARRTVARVVRVGSGCRRHCAGQSRHDGLDLRVAAGPVPLHVARWTPRRGAARHESRGATAAATTAAAPGTQHQRPIRRYPRRSSST